MSKYYNQRLLVGNCLDTLKQLADDSIDSVVTDPPYELGFMGKSWDSTGIAFNIAIWQECMRVLKPGGHLLAFSGSRTYHRMAVAIEDAGFEIRDQIMWLYGSGFPKSMAIDKAIEGKLTTGSSNKKSFKNLSGEQVDRGDWGIAKQQYDHGQRDTNYDTTAGSTRLGKLNPTTKEAKQWQGWGTALKPAHEPIVVARKPISMKTVAENVLTYGTGAINIDASRVGTEQLGGGTMPDLRDVGSMSKEATGIDKLSFGQNFRPATRVEQPSYTGRFPANVIHDGSDEVVELFPNTGDTGTAARFFYCAKTSKSERNAGLTNLPNNVGANGNKWTDQDYRRGDSVPTTERKNFHPTVKPLTLMRYLIKLVTPPNGTVLDPFLGSGSTAVAAILDNFNWKGCEMTEDYLPIIKGRVEHAIAEVKKAKQKKESTPTLFEEDKDEVNQTK